MKLPFPFLALCALALPARAADHPNIIFILTDDLGYGDVGVFHQNARRDAGDHGSPWHQTPQLDRMASEGLRLTNHYVAAPVCVSSRSSLLQGVTQGHAHVRDNQFDKELDANHTLATVLRAAGYRTAAIGKWGVQGQGPAPDWPAHPLNRGFDYYYGYIRHVDGHEHYPKEKVYFGEKLKLKGPIQVWENRTDVTAGLDKCYTADLWTARAKQWIVDQQRAHPGEPFFLYLAYDTPHAALELPTQAYPAGGGLHGGIQWLGTPGHMINTAAGTVDAWVHPDYAHATYDDDHNAATPERPWPDIYRRYATDVRRIDDGVGDLLQLLRDLRIDENTLVVFTSDNGPSIESYLPDEPITPEFFASFGPFDGIKRDCWEGGMRVPAIARWPAHIKPGGQLAAPTGTWDWLPTFAALAGLPAPARTDGISLADSLTDRGVLPEREALYFEYAVEGRTPGFKGFEPGHRNRLRGQMQALRLGDYVGVRYDIKSADDDFELYDVVTDPKEANNLFAAGNRDAPTLTVEGRATSPSDLQRRFKALAIQSRRPDADSPRPYDTALMPADEPPETAPGVAWQYFAGAYPWVPNFATATAATHGIARELDLGVMKPGQSGGMRFTGFLRVPADGEYTFALRTDTGAELRLHHATIIDADYGYEPGSPRRGTVLLKAGLHAFALSYRHDSTRAPLLDLTWSGPGGTRQGLADYLRITPAQR